MDDIKQSLKPGDLFAGKYRIERVLGEGGMGLVLSATHALTNDRVALKFLLSHAAESPDLRQRFYNEARAAVQIKSEHVARITDVDTMPSGLPYMVMEFLEGRDLGAVIEQRGGLSLATAVDYVLQACEALAEAHALRIVHRDLKPSNLFLTHRKDGSPLIKVLDFGISKLNNQSDQQLTRTRGAMGSPLYMSPEQMTNPKSVDPRSDIWSMGVVLFELLTADHPFAAETIEGLAVEIATRPHRPIRSLRPDLPEAIEAILGRCLAKSAAQRLSSIAELAEALAPFGSAQATASAERVSRVLSLPSPSPTSQPTIDPLPRPSAEAAQEATMAAPVVVKASPLEATGSHSWAKTHGAPALTAPPEAPAPEAPPARRRAPAWVPLASAAALLAAGVLVVLGSAKPGGAGSTTQAAPTTPAASAQASARAEPPPAASAPAPQSPAPQSPAPQASAAAPAPAASQASAAKKPEAPPAKTTRPQPQRGKGGPADFGGM